MSDDIGDNNKQKSPAVKSLIEERNNQSRKTDDNLEVGL
jgi:hypothetical protein